jgi:alpha-1,3-mannosyltransferase
MSTLARMRIVHVVRQFHPAIGGLESVVLALASAQLAQGHAVRVVTLNRIFNTSKSDVLPHRDSVAQVEIIRIPFVGSHRYPIAPTVINHIVDADIVHVHGIDFFFDYLAWTKPFHGRTLVASTHGAFFHTQFAAALKRIYFSTITRASLIWYGGVAAVSAADFETFRRIRSNGLVCIENGVDVHKYAAASSELPQKSIIALGRLSKHKRLDHLISLVAALYRADAEWKLHIVGRPWDLSVRDLETIARGQDVSEAVSIIASPGEDEIREIMGRCSFIASASEYEGFGLAAVEGMSAGLLPILSPIPSFQRLVDRSGIGVTVNFEHTDEAAVQLLAKWHESRNNYPEQRRAAMHAALQYDWPNVCRQYQRLYEGVMGTTTRSILDVPIQVITADAAIKLLDQRFNSREQTRVAFANANVLNIAYTARDFRQALQTSVVFNDGFGVDIASRLLFGSRFPDNLNGTDFTPLYLDKTKHRFRIFLLGGRRGVPDRALCEFAKRFPQHSFVGCRDGYFSHTQNLAIVNEISELGTDVVLVALGNPKQEIWLAENLAQTGCTLGFGVGALFDFNAGAVHRAPQWVRTIRFEWLYRLLQEPQRLWRRYILGNPTFLFRIIRSWWSGARITSATLESSYDL